MKPLYYIFLFVFTVSSAQSVMAQRNHYSKNHLSFESNAVINKLSKQNWHTGDREGEFLIDTNMVAISGLGDQLLPLIAFDGVNYMIIWIECRHGNAEIYGARVNQQGVLIDSAGIPIATVAEFQQAPSIIFDGTNYFVVWKDYRFSHGGFNSETDIYGARVSPSGNVLDSTGILLSIHKNQFDASESYPSVAFDGTNYLVVWEQEGNPKRIYGTRVSQSGIVLDSTCIAISRGAMAWHPSIAFDGTNYLVVWESYAGIWWDSILIYGARISTAGTVIDSPAINISKGYKTHGYPAVAFDNTNYFVVWEDARNYPIRKFDIYGARVSVAGLVLDTVGIPISSVPGGQRRPAIIYDGLNYLVVWQDMRSPSRGMLDIYGARVTSTGIVLDPSGIPISIKPMKRECLPSIGFDGTNYLVVWQDGRNYVEVGDNYYGYDIYGARMTQAGQVLDPSGISMAARVPGNQYCSAAAFDGTNYLVVWHDYHHHDSTSLFYADIYGMRVDQSGNILDTQAISISTAHEDQLYPSVAFDGTNYLVVWEDWRNVYSGRLMDVYGARVTMSGTVLDPSGFTVSGDPGAQYAPSVAFDGTNYFAVWERKGNAYRDNAIFGARITPNGTVIDTSAILITDSIVTSGTANPSVAFGNTNYLVTWAELRDDILCARVSPEGTVIDTVAIVVSNTSDYNCHSDVAFDGTNYFVAWENYSWPYPEDGSIYGARISEAGVVLDPLGIAISTAPKNQEYPSVAFDGTNYLVVWQDFRNGECYDIYGAKVSPSGSIINTYEVVNQPGDQIEPAVARGSSDQILLTYTGRTRFINTHQASVMRIWGKFYPFTAIDENTGYKPWIAGCRLAIYPNPFRNVTEIYIEQGAKGTGQNIELKIYDVIGRLVKSFVQLPETQITWFGDDDMGRSLPAGVYFCRLESGKEILEKKVILLR